jgi:hypothetical protein
MKILLEQAKRLEVDKFADGSECPIYQGLAKNPTLEDKLGSRNAKFIIDRSFDLKDCKKKPCEPNKGRNLKWPIIAGGAVIAITLIVGSGGTLAPFAIGAGTAIGGLTYVAENFLNKCPPPPVF